MIYIRVGEALLVEDLDGLSPYYIADPKAVNPPHHPTYSPKSAQEWEDILDLLEWSKDFLYCEVSHISETHKRQIYRVFDAGGFSPVQGEVIRWLRWWVTRALIYCNHPVLSIRRTHQPIDFWRPDE